MTITLISPLAVVRNDTQVVETIPTGTVINVSHNRLNSWAEVDWNDALFSAMLQDLLDACCPPDAARIGAWLSPDQK